MTELERCRSEIDAIDRELAALFLRRMAVTARVGEYKKANGIPVLDAQREQQVLAAKAALADNEADRAAVQELYEAIMAISRRQQEMLLERD